MAWPFDQLPISPQTTAPSLPGFLGLVATNPHGWGNAPLPDPQPQQSQGFGDDVANFAASKMPEVSYRAAMLPYGEDAQGHGHWAVPGMIYGPAMAAARLFGQGGFWNGPQDPQAASDMRDVLYSIYGGNALADAGRAAELAAVRTNPAVAARVYRGSPVGETWAPEGALRNTTFWASDNPEVAGYYAGDRGVGPNIVPADVSFKNPLVVDARRGPGVDRHPVGFWNEGHGHAGQSGADIWSRWPRRQKRSRQLRGRTSRHDLCSPAPWHSQISPDRGADLQPHRGNGRPAAA